MDDLKMEASWSNTYTGCSKGLLTNGHFFHTLVFAASSNFEWSLESLNTKIIKFHLR